MSEDGKTEPDDVEAAEPGTPEEASQKAAAETHGSSGDVADWEADVSREVDEDEKLRVDVEGFEGPLDLLLAMARTQKVDIAKISVLALARQYLAFIEEAKRLRLELAADYLVMAAWLTFLKSKLLLPPEPTSEDGPSGEELAAMLAFRLQRLDAMRDAAAQLMTRKRLGQDVFSRGEPEPIRVTRKSVYDANVYDLLKAYAQQRQRNAVRTLHMEKRTVWSLKEARSELERLLGVAYEWAPLDQLLAEFLVEPEIRRTALASSFTATLEMTREGALEIRQSKSFAPLLVRRRSEVA
ncbi:MAG: segregation/condensation protein A [Methyloceanibacter sp.]|uniref:segregation and condensation protein A n=1 Tax=Methyloceanibacter sp. TaxID=1965321 RepID=UPI001DE9E8B9|nr:ScpA family protein [Methyloceanibacter sp.]MCB1444009.1 segregation/condensation protein A [Methyloceanibacter sp.]MCC0058237.1 segregation/condensation protein A [Hyphomicrobiaceae bacterium]